jgi:hypothetical protein
MKLKNLLMVNAIVSALFGLGFVLVPGQVYAIYGVDMTDHLRYTSELFGAALIGLAVISWMARSAAPSTARSAIVTGFFVGESLGFIMALIGQFRDTAVSLGWLNVAIYLLIALGFAYFLFIKPE